ncbi:MAG: hypothetical protein AAF960_12360 [Bacteroidota bacterium]
MKYCIYILCLILVACSSKTEKNTSSNPNGEQPIAYRTTTTEHYELIRPYSKSEAVLLLFPGHGETPKSVQQSFKIVEAAIEKKIAIVFMTFNRRLWLTQKEKFDLMQVFNQLFQQQELDSSNVYIGGFSSGGNVSLLFTNHLKEVNNLIQPKGVFVVDAPVDLAALYEIAERNVQRNFSSISVQESTRTIQQFDSTFGRPTDSLSNYEQYSPFVFQTNHLDNLADLEDTKIRFYTEPDIEWWKNNRQNDYKDMNAFYIKALANRLVEKFGQKVEYIETNNKGYRPNGQRHPHSWSIVDVDHLLKWILNK